MKVVDLTGKTFGCLTVIKRADNKNKAVYWLCECECGNTKEIIGTSLTSGKTNSCGCLKTEIFSQIVSKDKENTQIEGINIHLLARKKLNKNNTTGVTGVYKHGGKFVARISFKRKDYNLGTYSTLEAAAKVRKMAENRLYGEFLEWYYETFPENKK